MRRFRRCERDNRRSRAQERERQTSSPKNAHWREKEGHRREKKVGESAFPWFIFGSASASEGTVRIFCEWRAIVQRHRAMPSQVADAQQQSQRVSLSAGFRSAQLISNEADLHCISRCFQHECRSPLPSQNRTLGVEPESGTRRC